MATKRQSGVFWYPRCFQRCYSSHTKDSTILYMTPQYSKREIQTKNRSPSNIQSHPLAHRSHRNPPTHPSSPSLTPSTPPTNLYLTQASSPHTYPQPQRPPLPSPLSIPSPPTPSGIPEISYHKRRSEHKDKDKVPSSTLLPSIRPPKFAINPPSTHPPQLLSESLLQNHTNVNHRPRYDIGHAVHNTHGS